jgi:hypothetical protein
MPANTKKGGNNSKVIERYIWLPGRIPHGRKD